MTQNGEEMEGGGERGRERAELCNTDSWGGKKWRKKEVDPTLEKEESFQLER